jgi:hypothetical protein
MASLRRSLALAILSASALCVRVPAQEGPQEDLSAPSPGSFSLGPFYFTPRLKINTLGLDTNVFYTAVKRQTDLGGSGGPGLEVRLPLGPSLVFSTIGNVDYVFYLRTTSQRRFGGDAAGRLELKNDRVRALADETYSGIFERPSFEVDSRVFESVLATNAAVTVGVIGRLSLHGEGHLARYTYEGTFLGANLAATLDRQTDVAALGFEVAVTPKTALIAQGDYQTDRFVIATSRAADSNRLYGGFRIDSETRLFGRAVGGVRLFRPRDSPQSAGIIVPYGDVDLHYVFGPKTRLGLTYTQDLSFSAFEVTGPTSTLRTEVGRATLERVLFGNVDLRLNGGLTRLRTDGLITIVRADGSVATGKRSDTVEEGGANLGYRFRSRLRIGVGAQYVSRQSTFTDFGIQGLLLGATATFEPHRP